MTSVRKTGLAVVAVLGLVASGGLVATAATPKAAPVYKVTISLKEQSIVAGSKGSTAFTVKLTKNGKPTSGAVDLFYGLTTVQQAQEEAGSGFCGSINRRGETNHRPVIVKTNSKGTFTGHYFPGKRVGFCYLLAQAGDPVQAWAAVDQREAGVTADSYTINPHSSSTVSIAASSTPGQAFNITVAKTSNSAAIGSDPTGNISEISSSPGVCGAMNPVWNYTGTGANLGKVTLTYQPSSLFSNTNTPDTCKIVFQEADSGAVTGTITIKQTKP